MAFTASVITTTQWGARPAGPFPRTIPRYVIIHHTADPNPPNDRSKGTVSGAKRLARETQDFHLKVRGWSDSGHNFLNTNSGILLEGRHGSLSAAISGHSIQSAHALQDPGKLAHGNQSPGIENEGNFMTFQMGDQQWNSLVELCTSLCSSCQISPRDIRGHRDFSDTDCPGDWLYGQLPKLRREVAEKLGMNLDPDSFDNRRPARTLKFGSTGPDVTKLQEVLVQKGFSPGLVDGIFGDGTRAAVIAFQDSVGLEKDGIVGPDTRLALDL